MWADSVTVGARVFSAMVSVLLHQPMVVATPRLRKMSPTELKTLVPKEKMVALRAKGVSYGQLAKELGISESAVYRLCKSYNLVKVYKTAKQ